MLKGVVGPKGMWTQEQRELGQAAFQPGSERGNLSLLRRTPRAKQVLLNLKPYKVAREQCKKALQINLLRKWSYDNSLGKYFQALDAFSCGSTFLPCLAAVPGKHCLCCWGSWSCP